jgi:hypothetical protein
MIATRGRRKTALAALAAAVATIEGSVTRAAAFQQGWAVAVAVLVDLMLFLSLLFFLLVLRLAIGDEAACHR